MREQIRRILGLVRDGRLSHDDAITLLAALNPKLIFKDETMLRLIGLMSDEEFGVDRVVDLIVRRIEPGAGQASQQSQSQSGGAQQSQSQSQQSRPASGSQPSATFRIGGQRFEFDDLGDAISSRVDEALGGLLGKSGRSPRPGTILKIESENEDGATFSANLPISLAEHAERLIPPHAQKSLAKSGLSMDAIKLLLKAGPPPGPLLEAEDEDGNSVRLSIK